MSAPVVASEPISKSQQDSWQASAANHLWPQFTERSDKEGWAAARLLMALAEHEDDQGRKAPYFIHLND